jgi:hypothetical protein
MAKTTISDLFRAELWTADDFIEAPELKNILNSGILVQDPKLQNIVNATGAGVKFELPYIDEPDYTEPEGMDESTVEVTPKKIAWNNMFTMIGMYSNSYEYTHLANLLSRDSDPATVIRDVVGNYWGRDLQNRIIAGAVGVSAKAGADLTLDVADDSSDGADVTLESAIIVDGIGLQGDHQDKFSFMFMHSKVYGDLKKQNLIETIQPTEVGAKPINMYGMYVVIVNDLMPVEQGENKKKYTTLVAQNGMFAYADKNLGDEMPVLEPVRNPLSGRGAGSTKIITRKGFCLHPVGFSYVKNTMNPTIADFKNKDSWSMKLKPKQQKFVAIITN